MSDARAICDALGFDPTNHHNALRCPYCSPPGVLVERLMEVLEGECDGLYVTDRQASAIIHHLQTGEGPGPFES